jgi:hypothetical protein
MGADEACIRAHRQGRALNSSEKEEDQEDDKDESQGTAWVIAPSATVWPCRQRTHEENNKYD